MFDIKNILNLLENNIPFVYVSIADQSGSVPRKSKAQMYVTIENDKEKTYGTIGGGRVEAEATLACLEMLKKKSNPYLLSFDLSSEDAAHSDMICGGSLKLYLNLILPNDKNKALFKKLNQYMEKRRKVFLYNPLKPGLDIQIKEEKSDIDDYFCEEIFLKQRIYIFGAGHVGKATAQLADFLGFDVHMLDDRKEYLNLSSPLISQHLCDFKNCIEPLNIHEEDSLVILSRGHLYDKEILQQCLRTKAKYIGMIGSKRKKALLYAELEKENVLPAELEKVHCPIGVKLPVETPEEIALCIMAEILAGNGNK